MTSETVNTARRVRPSLHYRMVRSGIIRQTCHHYHHYPCSVQLYKNTFVVVRTCLYINVLTLDFHSECFTSTARVFTLKLFPSRLFELYITLLSCVGLLTPKFSFFHPPHLLQPLTKLRQFCPSHLTPPRQYWSVGRYAVELLWRFIYLLNIGP